jgi:cytochrome P450
MGDLTFGEPLGLLEKSDYTPWVALIFQTLKFATYMRALKHLPAFRFLFDHWVPKAMEAKRGAHFKYSVDQVNKRLEAKVERPDIWGIVLRQGELGRGLSLKEMHSNAALFMGAGTETTATEVSGLLYLLLRNPVKLERMVKEIRGALRTDEDITMDALSQLPYLHACIDEGLRLYPPVPIGLPRIVPTGGSVIANRFVPGGVSTIFFQSHLPHIHTPHIFLLLRTQLTTSPI